MRERAIGLYWWKAKHDSAISIFSLGKTMCCFFVLQTNVTIQSNHVFRELPAISVRVKSRRKSTHVLTYKDFLPNIWTSSMCFWALQSKAEVKARRWHVCLKRPKCSLHALCGACGHLWPPYGAWSERPGQPGVICGSSVPQPQQETIWCEDIARL